MPNRSPTNDQRPRAQSYETNIDDVFDSEPSAASTPRRVAAPVLGWYSDGAVLPGVGLCLMYDILYNKIGWPSFVNALLLTLHRENHIYV